MQQRGAVCDQSAKQHCAAAQDLGISQINETEHEAGGKQKTEDQEKGARGDKKGDGGPAHREFAGHRLYANTNAIKEGFAARVHEFPVPFLFLSS